MKIICILFLSVSAVLGQFVLWNQQPATGQAILAYDTNWLNFGTNLTAVTNDLTVWITNIGDSVLSGSASTASPFSLVGITSYAMATNDATNIVVRYTRSGDANDTNELALTGGQCTTNIHLSGYSTNPPASDIYPTNLAGYPVLCWFVADDYSSNATKGAYLDDRWTSGWSLTNKALLQSPTTNSTLLNGHKTLYFNRQRLFCSQFTNPQPVEVTMFLNQRPDAGTEGRYFNTDTPLTRGRVSSSGVLELYAGGSYVGSALMMSNQWVMVSFALNGASSVVYTNYVQDATGNAGDRALGQTFGLMSDSGAAAPCKCDFAEMVVYPTNLALLARSNLYFYFTNKYDIHP